MHINLGAITELRPGGTRLATSWLVANAPSSENAPPTGYTPELLSTITQSITQTLKVPYAAVALQQAEHSQVVAEWGKAPLVVEWLPLTYRHEVLGQLLVAPRRPDERLTPGDYRLLQEIAHETGGAIHALRLTLDLQRAREGLVMAREEERRRLRRDLHDGLGPQLATLTLKIDAARNLLLRDPAQADRLLVEYKTQTRAALCGALSTTCDHRRWINWVCCRRCGNNWQMPRVTLCRLN